MELALSFNQADAVRIEKYAAERNMSVLAYAKKILQKGLDEEEAREKANAEYLAMLDESERQIREGRVVVKTMAELEAMAAE